MSLASLEALLSTCHVRSWGLRDEKNGQKERDHRIGEHLVLRDGCQGIEMQTPGLLTQQDFCKGTVFTWRHLLIRGSTAWP